LDALIIGYYEKSKLLYAARTRNGFTPASRIEIFKPSAGCRFPSVVFANLPEKESEKDTS
jgi:hypothetical protein